MGLRMATPYSTSTSACTSNIFLNIFFRFPTVHHCSLVCSRGFCVPVFSLPLSRARLSHELYHPSVGIPCLNRLEIGGWQPSETRRRARLPSQGMPFGARHRVYRPGTTATSYARMIVSAARTVATGASRRRTPWRPGLHRGLRGGRTQAQAESLRVRK